MTQRRFVFIAEGDVFMQLLMQDDFDKLAPMWAAGLSSNPVVVEVTNSPNVVPGWTYDGESFYSPEQ
jgi:hypothetical protein